MAPLHTHESESEGFYVLEGEVSVVVGDRTLTVTAGSFAFVPPKVRHAFRVVSPEAKFLTIIAPAGLRAFFEEMGGPAASRSLPPPPEGAAGPRSLGGAGGQVRHHDPRPATGRKSLVDCQRWFDRCSSARLLAWGSGLGTPLPSLPCPVARWS